MLNINSVMLWLLIGLLRLLLSLMTFLSRDVIMIEIVACENDFDRCMAQFLS